jgi:hypothetical protein
VYLVFGQVDPGAERSAAGVEPRNVHTGVQVLGLAWEDLDLEDGTAKVRRASVYVDGRGQQLGPPKTEGARGEHWLMPTVVALLAERREMQAQEREAAPVWDTATYDGEYLARFVGHANPSTTAGYVRRVGQRPEAVAKRAAAVLDGDQAHDGEDTTGVRNHPADLGSNAGSYRPEPSDSPANDAEQ